MKDIIFWLRQIFDALTSLGASVQNKSQTNWNESDSTKASYLQNKPYIPSVVIIEGTVSDSAFTPSGTNPKSVADAIVSLLKGDIVYLKYTSDSEAVYEIVSEFNSDAGSIATANLTWTTT